MQVSNLLETLRARAIDSGRVGPGGGRGSGRRASLEGRQLEHELHPDGVVTYVVDRNVNYTNICFSVCNFCAFYRKPGSPDGYVLSHEDIFRKVEETIELGGTESSCRAGCIPTCLSITTLRCSEA